MSADSLRFDWWVDDDLGLWVRHRCTEGIVDEWHPPSTWAVIDGHIEPSFDCELCGAHTHLSEFERIDPPAQQALREGSADGT